MTNADQETNGLMRIAVFVDPAWVWCWHKWLVEALGAKGHRVDLCIAGIAHDIPSKLRLLLQLERLLYGQGGENASDLITIEQFNNVSIIDQPARTGYDLVIDLAGDTRLSQFRCRRFRPLYDGMVGTADLIGILLDGHAPRLALDDSALPEPRRIGLSAVEQPEIILRGLNNVYSRMAGALIKSVDAIADNLETTPPDALSGERAHRKRRKAPLKAGCFLLGSFATKIANRLTKLVRGGGHDRIRWGMAWRFTQGQPVRETHELPVEQYTRLKDDGQRFFADPFVIWRNGVHHVFVEEFPFATEKGIISHFTIDQHGQATTPKEVLSRPYHLSYPFVFEQGGEFWMIPETSGNQAVELYRAERFPDKWVFEKTLINNIMADDVTLMKHQDRLWMFAAVSDWQSSKWDALGLFYADDLHGTWQAHQANPVLLDARAARPAGALYRKDGELWRPAQDCSTGYGAGLSLCRVDRLDPVRFEQSVEHHFAPKGKGNLTGLHTLNEDHGLEVIDFYGRL